jgi:hypothetical protein
LITPAVMALIRTIGVWPIASRMFSQIFFTRQVYRESAALY